MQPQIKVNIEERRNTVPVLKCFPLFPIPL